MGTGPSISVVIPVYGNREPIDQVISEIHSLLSPCSSFEIIIVWTPDHESLQSSSLNSSKWDNTKIVMEPQRGYGRAYMTGFAQASGDIIVTLDADGTYPAKEILRLARRLTTSGSDFLSTNRLLRHEVGAFTPIKRFGNLFFSVLLRLLFGVKFKDSQSGMWVFRREILKSLNLHETGMAYSSEIKIEVHQTGYRYIEIPIRYHRRKGGQTSLNWVRDGLQILGFLLKRRFATKLRQYSSYSMC